MYAIIFNLLILLKEKRFIHEPLGAPGTIPALIVIIIIAGVIIYFKVESDSLKDKNESIETQRFFKKWQRENYMSQLKGLILEHILENPNHWNIKDLIEEINVDYPHDPFAKSDFEEAIEILTNEQSIIKVDDLYTIPK